MDVRFRRSFLRPPTIRTLVALWAGSVLLAWVILVSGWFVAKNQLSRISNHVATDIEAMDATHRLEAAILAYRHDDLLWHATDQHQYQQGEQGYLTAAEQIVDSFSPYIDTPKEADLLATIREKLRVLRSQLALVGPQSTEVESGSAYDLLGVVHDLEKENEDQMEASIKVAGRLQDKVSDYAMGLSVGTAILLLGGALGLMRRIIRPALALNDAAAAFGQGDFSTRAAALHDDELGALARTFNNMAGDIADREKDRLQFVAMVVHDLKNPVLAIEMATRVLLESHTTEEECCSYLDGIREEATRLRGIIRDLTDDVQVANGRFSVHTTELDLSTLVRRFVETRSKAYAGHEIVLKTDEGCTIRGDADRIERVLTNLVSNAVKYSPSNTCVTLRVEREDAQVVLSVTDQGPGIGSDDLKVIFQPFGRGRSANTLAEGTGMGLYVVKQIVEAHAGRIEVQSEPGHGATFQIWLPLVEAVQASESLTAANSPEKVPTL